MQPTTENQVDTIQDMTAENPLFPEIIDYTRASTFTEYKYRDVDGEEHTFRAHHKTGEYVLKQEVVWTQQPIMLVTVLETSAGEIREISFYGWDHMQWHDKIAEQKFDPFQTEPRPRVPVSEDNPI